MDSRYIETDLAIIGMGLAGTAAAIFAGNRGMSCTVAGNTGALTYTTGYLDLLGFLDSRIISNPWENLIELKNVSPGHPLADISATAIESAFAEFITFVGEHGIGYSSPGKTNICALTPAGTIKPTLCVPKTMENGIEALENKDECTIFGFHGLKGFSGSQIVANLRKGWPKLQQQKVAFPGHRGGELYPEAAARSLEVAENRKLLAEIINREAGASPFVGVPALLGMHKPDVVLAELQRLTGRLLFEIPTMPPSIPGIRLREMFEQALPGKNRMLVPRQKVEAIDFSNQFIELELSDNRGSLVIRAKSALLATGRFLSSGLTSRFDGISESLIGLPVYQPPSRRDWYRKEYFDSRGHDIHLAGIETDGSFRPLGHSGKPFDPRLFCAGTVLAHQDWIRQRCGAGLAIATAYRAVEETLKYLESGRAARSATR